MSNSVNPDFDAFVKRQQVNEGSIDWNSQREEWLAALEYLYELAQDFLASYIKEGTIVCEFKHFSLTEDDIGTYDTREMVIHIGNEKVRLVPVGTMLIGSKGRVDVLGRAGSGRIVLMQKSARNFRDMIKLKINIVNGRSLRREINEKDLQNRLLTEGNQGEWTWKIVNANPLMAFDELTAESFMQLLLEVCNG